MKLLGLEVRAAERRDSPESVKSSATAEEMWRFFGLQQGNLPNVTIDTALQVPAVSCAVDFLASAMASVPRHAFKVTKEDGKSKVEKVGGKLQRIVNEAPNPEWSSFEFWKYIWTQRFTGGRGLAWIERAGGLSGPVVGLWPIDPTKTTIKRIGTRKVYEFTGGGRSQVYDPSEIIDLPFMLKADQLSSYSPIKLGEKAIQLALAMNDYGSGFFAGGGIPPLALEGPLPKNTEATNRAASLIDRAVKQAREMSRPFFGMPPGHALKAIGIEPEKGQLVEARRFQVEEIARVYRLPPAFLQDLTHGTFSNVEQQDLNLVKHLIAQLARQAEDELNLKLFGADKNSRYIEHNLDGLLRGDFKSRIEAMARGIQSGQLLPDEARELENRPPVEGGDRAYIQGATVPLTMAGTKDAQASAAAANAAGDGPTEPGGDPTKGG
jgi:HK97 family phage portal protein